MTQQRRRRRRRHRRRRVPGPLCAERILCAIYLIYNIPCPLRFLFSHSLPNPAPSLPPTLADFSCLFRKWRARSFPSEPNGSGLSTHAHPINVILSSWLGNLLVWTIGSRQIACRKYNEIIFCDKKKVSNIIANSFANVAYFGKFQSICCIRCSRTFLWITSCE